MGMLGIITGTLTRDLSFFNNAEERVMQNVFGKTVILITDDVAVIPRHGRDQHKYILPHLINHQANITAFKDLGVDEVIAINSTGSLKKHLKPGMIMVPDDFILPFGGPTVFSTEAVHIIPTIREEIRRMLIQAAARCEIDVVDGGIYWQTKGPRLETRAEIAMMGQFADIVGMTMASEAIIAKELRMPYASLCSIDNFGHGIGAKKLSIEEIREHAQKNAKTVMQIIYKYIERRKQ